MGSDESHFNVSVGSDRQSHKTVSTNHNLFEEKGEPKRIRTEVLPLTSLTPYRWAKPAHLSPFDGVTSYGRVWRKGAGKRDLKCDSKRLKVSKLVSKLVFYAQSTGTVISWRRLKEQSVSVRTNLDLFVKSGATRQDDTSLGPHTYNPPPTHTHTRTHARARTHARTHAHTQTHTRTQF